MATSSTPSPERTSCEAISISDDASRTHSSEKVWTVGLLPAYFLEVECRHVLDAHVGERHSRDASRLDAEHCEIVGQAARQIQIEQDFALAVMHKKEIARTSAPDL